MALRLLDHAVSLARADGDQAVEAQVLQALANVHVVGEDFPLAVRGRYFLALFELLHDWQSVGDVRGQRALSAFNRRQADAERWWLGALSAYEAAGARASQARTVRNLSFLWRLKPAEKLALARQAVDLAATAGDSTTEGMARHNFSDYLYGAGEIAAAAQQLQLAIALLERAPESKALARAFTSAGRLHRVLGRPAESVALNTRSAQVLERLGDLDGAAQALDAVTVARTALGSSNDAVASAAAALAMARRSGKTVPLVRALCRMATALATAGQGAVALPLLDEAAPLAPTVEMTALYWEARSAVLASIGRLEEALRIIEAQPKRGALDDRIWAGYRHAAVLRRLGRGDDAGRELRAVVQLIDEMAEKLVPDDASKRGYFDSVAALVALHVQVLADLGEPEAALEASERGRARAFQDLLLSRALDGFSPGTPPPTSTLPGRTDAATLIARSGIAPVPAPVPAEPVPVATLEELLVRRGADAAPTTYSSAPAVPSAATARVPSLQDVRRVAASLGSHLLVYWVGNEETLIWVVSPTGPVTMVRSPVGNAALTELARTAVGSVGEPVRGAGGLAFSGGSRTALRRLYDALIEPVRGSLLTAPNARLTIVPHGPLFRVSFAGLPNRRGRYLLEDYRLHYGPSIGALAEARQGPRGDGPVLLVVDPALAVDAAGAPSLPRLPAAAAEGRAIVRALRGRDVELLGGRDASEARVRQMLPRASVVHFATHGVVSDAAPWTSYLALAGTSAQLDDDGHLSAGELYDLRLTADLVVLGACRTATGPDTTDGVTGLARAFLASGVPTVVASLWDLPDTTTARMQPAFYRQWAAQASASDALRGAQLKLLGELRAGRVTVNTSVGALTVPEHPSLWAGLIAIGAP